MNKDKVVRTIIIVQTIICLILVVMLTGQQKEQENKGVYISTDSEEPNEVDKAHLSGYNAGYREAMKYANKNMVFNKSMVE